MHILYLYVYKKSVYTYIYICNIYIYYSTGCVCVYVWGSAQAGSFAKRWPGSQGSERLGWATQSALGPNSGCVVKGPRLCTKDIPTLLPVSLPQGPQNIISVGHLFYYFNIPFLHYYILVSVSASWRILFSCTRPSCTTWFACSAPPVLQDYSTNTVPTQPILSNSILEIRWIP